MDKRDEIPNLSDLQYSGYEEFIKQEIHEEPNNFSAIKIEPADFVVEQNLHIKNEIIETNIHEEIDPLDVKIEIKNRVYCCNFCGKYVKNNKTLKKHIKDVHANVIYQKCETCGKEFRSLGNLNKHIKAVHEGVKNFKCDKCDKAFSSTSSLKLHISCIHEGVKDHKCEACGKAFSTSQNLEMHITAVHEGQKNHECGTCGRAFHSPYYLQLHIRDHP